MDFEKRFKKNEKSAKPTEAVEKKEESVDLKSFCGEDTELLAMLKDNILLNPARTTMEEAEKKAKELESLETANLISAGMYYKFAGCIALFNGNVKKVKKHFSKYHRLFPEKPIPILNNPEKAVAKAQEYYQKCMQKEKETEA